MDTVASCLRVVQFRWQSGRVVVLASVILYNTVREGRIRWGGTDAEAFTMTYHHGGLYFQCSVNDAAFCWYYFQYHSQYYGFSGHNQAYNQTEISGDLLFSFSLIRVVVIDNTIWFCNVNKLWYIWMKKYIRKCIWKWGHKPRQSPFPPPIRRPGPFFRDLHHGGRLTSP